MLHKIENLVSNPLHITRYFLWPHVPVAKETIMADYKMDGTGGKRGRRHYMVSSTKFSVDKVTFWLPRDIQSLKRKNKKQE